MNYRRTNQWIVWLFCVAGLICTDCSVVEAQTGSINLSSEGLKAHASLPRFNKPSSKLQDLMETSRVRANASGIPWTGMDFILSDAPPPLVDPNLLSRIYSQLTCKCDSVAVGSVIRSISHLSDNGSTIYTDYEFAVDEILKSAQAGAIAPLVSGNHVVVTRLGGSLPDLGRGPLSYRSEEFPGLQQGFKYLLFLKGVPLTGGYELFDSRSTLVFGKGYWTVFTGAYTNLEFPALAAAKFEAEIGAWSYACN